MGLDSSHKLLMRLLVELAVLGKVDTHLRRGAAELVALAAPVEPPTSPLYAKHPRRECKSFLTHQAQHSVQVCREEPYACETSHADMESTVQALLSSLPSGK